MQDLRTASQVDGVKEKLIEHLSSEIATAMSLLTAQRTRNNLTVAFGPYILLGGYLLAVERVPDFSAVPRPLLIVGALLFVVAYAVAGWLSATIEGRIWDQCNHWRSVIARLGGVSIEDVVFDRRGLLATYIAIYAALGLTFCLILLLMSRLP